MRKGWWNRGIQIPFVISVTLTVLIFPVSSSLADSESLNVDRLIEEAILSNLDILAAKAKWEVYKEKVPQAAALDDPMFSFGVINLPTNFNFKDEDMTMKEFSVSQKLPFPGKRPLMKEMAEKEADAVSTEIQGRIHQIIKEIKTAYYELSHVYRATEVIQRNKQILEVFAKIAETRYAVGEGIQQDVIKAHVEVSKMIDELIMLEQRKKALEGKLNALLNRSQETPMGKPEDVIFSKFLYSIEELQKMAWEMNPTLKGMKKMIEAKEKAYALAKREYYPDFNLKFAYGQRDSTPNGISRMNMLTGMVEVNIPIFYKSKQDRKVAETKAEIQLAEAQYRAMKNEVLFMITDMVSMVQRVERQIDLYKTGIIPQASLQVNSAMSAYRVNKADFMTLLDSQMTLYKYELVYHQALTEYEKNVASLGAVTGKQLFKKGEER
jgi:outer membrane protein, heavy metal efflux system